MATGLTVVGLVLATRPVGDEAARAHATSQVAANVVSAPSWWDGQYVVTLDWYTGNQFFTTRFVLPQASPPWSEPGYLELLFDPHHPTTVALADPGWSLNSDFRAAAAFESVVPFTMALLALALLVIRPPRRSAAFTPDSIRRARGSLRRYLLTPALICTLPVVALVVIQDQPMLMYSSAIDNVASIFTLVFLGLLIWLSVRAVRFARLRRLLTVVDDAADRGAVVISVTDRRVVLDTKIADSLAGGQVGDDHRSSVRIVALRGQRPQFFQPGQTVRLFGRWGDRGAALVTDGDKVVIGFGKRRAGPDRIADSLGRQYPSLLGKPRSYLAWQLLGLIIVNAASIAVVAGARLNPGWLWLPGLADMPWLGIVLNHYSSFRALLRKPCVAHHGVVLSVTVRRRGNIVATIEVPDKPTRRWKPIGERRRPHWLGEDQEVVMLQLPTAEVSDTAVVATPDGHAALVVQKATVPAR